ncbi:hypothetical protein ACG3SK_28390 [Pseudomonas aeruginosa]
MLAGAVSAIGGTLNPFFFTNSDAETIVKKFRIGRQFAEAGLLDLLDGPEPALRPSERPANGLSPNCWELLGHPRVFCPFGLEM